MNNWTTGSGYSLNKNRYVNPARKSAGKGGKQKYCYWRSSKPDPATILERIKRTHPPDGSESDFKRVRL